MPNTYFSEKPSWTRRFDHAWDGMAGESMATFETYMGFSSFQCRNACLNYWKKCAGFTTKIVAGAFGHSTGAAENRCYLKQMNGVDSVPEPTYREPIPGYSIYSEWLA